MVASYKGHVEVVDKLLQHGATVDLQDNVLSQYTHKQNCNLIGVLNVWKHKSFCVCFYTLDSALRRLKIL